MPNYDWRVQFSIRTSLVGRQIETFGPFPNRETAVVFADLLGFGCEVLPPDPPPYAPWPEWWDPETALPKVKPCTPV